MVEARAVLVLVDGLISCGKQVLPNAGQIWKRYLGDQGDGYWI